MEWWQYCWHLQVYCSDCHLWKGSIYIYKNTLRYILKFLAQLLLVALKQRLHDREMEYS